jgi:hypothetical protein
MQWRETATSVTIMHRITGAKAPSVYFYGKPSDAVKHVMATNTLIKRFPERWMCF